MKVRMNHFVKCWKSTIYKNRKNGVFATNFLVDCKYAKETALRKINVSRFWLCL